MQRKEEELNASGLKFAIVVSQFNELITNRLLDGALQTIEAAKGNLQDVEVVRVPGAFEIPLTAQTLAKTRRFHAVICLGCVVRGETAHFDLIVNAATNGICQAMLATGIPMTHGILATDTLELALARSEKNDLNRGSENAKAAITMARLFRQFSLG